MEAEIRFREASGRSTKETRGRDSGADDENTQSPANRKTDKMVRTGEGNNIQIKILLNNTS